LGDLVAASLRRWRGLDLSLDREVVECAVVSAYLEEGGQAGGVRLEPGTIDDTGLQRRRCAAAAGIMRTLADRAITAPDGTVAWIAPVLSPSGMRIQPLGLDLYAGLPGVALLLSAYEAEVAAGRADPVPPVSALRAQAVHTLQVMHDQVASEWRENPHARPEPPGGYVGLGSRIWSWMALARLGAVTRDEGLARSTALAGQIPEISDTGARWPGIHPPGGLSGFAHGALGIGWALARLDTATGQARFTQLADAAFTYQESLYDPDAGGWRDPRKADGIATNWCYGCDGLPVVAADLAKTTADAGGDGVPRWRDVLRRAAVSTWTSGMGETHTLCHGDMGSWKALCQAAAAGVLPTGVTREDLAGRILSSLEEFGPRCAVTTNVFRAGLLSGMGGVAYTLLRMHPHSQLPSLLLPDPPADSA
jgi:lantibiotic modifying enzyme